MKPLNPIWQHAILNIAASRRLTKIFDTFIMASVSSASAFRSLLCPRTLPLRFSVPVFWLMHSFAGD